MENEETKLARHYIGAGSLALTGLIYIALGISLFFWMGSIPRLVKLVIFAFLIFLSITSLSACFSKFSLTKLIRGLIPAIFGFIFLFNTATVSNLYTRFIGFYIIFFGLIKLADYFVQRSSGIEGRSLTLFAGIFIILMGLPLFIDPIMNSSRALLLTGIFCIFYGMSVLGDFVIETFGWEQSKPIKKKIRISLPIFLTFLLPKKSINYINKLLSVDDDQSLVEESFKEDGVPDLEVFVHVTDGGFGMMGHADLFFEGKVYCYGNYDDASYKLFGSYGDGVFFTTTDRERYIQFCAKSTGDSIFAFGLRLTDEQKQSVRDCLAEIMSHTYPWESKWKRYKDGNYSSEKEPDDYASQLYQETKAEMYKFKDTSYKKYFVMTTNCVKLADEVVRSTGIQSINQNGILAPGTYYDFLNRQYRMAHSVVISRQTYHSHAKIVHEAAK